MLIHTMYIQARFRSLYVVHSFVRQPRFLISSLAAGGSHTVPVSSYNHTPSA